MVSCRCLKHRRACSRRWFCHRAAWVENTQKLRSVSKKTSTFGVSLRCNPLLSAAVLITRHTVTTSRYVGATSCSGDPHLVNDLSRPGSDAQRRRVGQHAARSTLAWHTASFECSWLRKAYQPALALVRAQLVSRGSGTPHNRTRPQAPSLSYHFIRLMSKRRYVQDGVVAVRDMTRTSLALAAGPGPPGSK